MIYVPPAPTGAKTRSRSPKDPKYKNKKIEFRGMKFDSIGERDRYICLLQDQEEGRIRNLQRQVKFPLTCKNVVVCHYIADFVYEVPKTTDQIKNTGFCLITGHDGENYWIQVVEDFKGVLTDTFQLKAKMFKAEYGYDITITKRKAWRSSNVMEGKSWKVKK